MSIYMTAEDMTANGCSVSDMWDLDEHTSFDDNWDTDEDIDLNDENEIAFWNNILNEDENTADNAVDTDTIEIDDHEDDDDDEEIVYITPSDIRAWAVSEGLIEEGKRGRIAKEIEDKYYDVHDLIRIENDDEDDADCDIIEITPSQIRKWAEDNHMIEKGKRGRLSHAIIDEYYESHGIAA